MTGKPEIVHETIRIERVFKAAPERVFAAWEDSDARRRWEPTPDGMEMDYEGFDFRTGGYEKSHLMKDGAVIVSFDTRYIDIVPAGSIVTSVRVISNGAAFSCMQSTIEFHPEGTGTRLVCCEQAAFMTGESMRSAHENGWGVMLDRLEKEVDG
ncbi:SRPBCC domain-containing protein [Nitratireductor sp. XY-223]|uniref:SRPBCC domain-containing protein n=1 Tax=Nitratireductor sp. XY-223 TaxID=2561926 RepID=UPI0010AB0712|nr:SRPBCC domain-containing protein [Nitratireductor sp. XY-223]